MQQGQRAVGQDGAGELPLDGRERRGRDRLAQHADGNRPAGRCRDWRRDDGRRLRRKVNDLDCFAVGQRLRAVDLYTNEEQSVCLGR